MLGGQGGTRGGEGPSECVIEPCTKPSTEQSVGGWDKDAQTGIIQNWVRWMVQARKWVRSLQMDVSRLNETV